jgi:hypothetical protein
MTFEFEHGVDLSNFPNILDPNLPPIVAVIPLPPIVAAIPLPPTETPIPLLPAEFLQPIDVPHLQLDES